jgi:hypothetical protein
VLEIGGLIETNKGKFSDVGQLPSKPFRVVVVLLEHNRQVTDDNLGVILPKNLAAFGA